VALQGQIIAFPRSLPANKTAGDCALNWLVWEKLKSVQSIRRPTIRWVRDINRKEMERGGNLGICMVTEVNGSIFVLIPQKYNPT